MFNAIYDTDPKTPRFYGEGVTWKFNTGRDGLSRAHGIVWGSVANQKAHKPAYVILVEPATSGEGFDYAVSKRFDDGEDEVRYERMMIGYSTSFPRAMQKAEAAAKAAILADAKN